MLPECPAPVQWYKHPKLDASPRNSNAFVDWSDLKSVTVLGHVTVIRVLAPGEGDEGSLQEIMLIA
eukprot:686999-Rhodomonas_salina.1